MILVNAGYGLAEPTGLDMENFAPEGRIILPIGMHTPANFLAAILHRAALL